MNEALIDRRCATADEVAAWVAECGRSGQGGQPDYAEPAATCKALRKEVERYF